MESRLIRDATEEDIIKFKRGNKNVDFSKYVLCQCWCGRYWTPNKINPHTILGLPKIKHRLYKETN